MIFFFWGGGVPYPIYFCMNLLVRFKLGYTPNFAALDHLEVPYKFVVVGGWWWLGVKTNFSVHLSPFVLWLN